MQRLLHLLILLPLLLAGCGGGSSDSGSGSQISLSTNTVVFSAAIGGTAPEPQVVTISGSGYIGLNHDGADLVATSLSPTGNTTMDLTLTPYGPTALTAGVHTEYVHVYVCNDSLCGNGPSESKTITITYYVTEDGNPLTTGIGLTNSALSYAFYTGDSAASQSVGIFGDNVTWHATANANWISLSTTSSTSPSTLEITANPSGLATGSYNGTVTVTGSDGVDKTITISMDVSPVALVSSPVSLDFNGTLGASIASKSIALSLNNGAATNWTASSDAGWVVLSGTSGATPSTVTISVNPSAGPLASGIHSATVTFSADIGGSVVTTSLPITLTLTKPTLDLTPNALSFSGINGASLPAQSINVKLSNNVVANWTASSSAGWVVLSSASGTTPSTLSISVDPSVGSLASGTHNATVTFNTTINGSTITTTLPITLTLTKPAFVLSKSTLSFSGVNGSSLSTQNVTVSLTNSAAYAWSASSSNGWLVLPTASGTTTSTLTVGVNPAVGVLASGSYNGTVTLNTKVNGDTISTTLPVSLTLTPATFTVTPSSVVLGGTSGLDYAAQTAQIRLNTNANAYTWTATTASPWLKLDKSSGSASATADSITLDVNSRAGMKGGSYQANLNLSAQINGDQVTTTVPVTLNLSAHYLLPRVNGVAFTKTPSMTKTTRSITIDDTYGLTATQWTANSDQNWLTVTPSGTVANPLVLTADPTGLSADQLYTATVTLSSPDSSVENNATIKVGLWLGSSDPVDSSMIISGATALATDPVRPYVYVHSGGSNIAVYNVYTKAMVTTLTGVAVSAGDMAVSSDGTQLYTVDTSNAAVTVTDLATANYVKSIPLVAGGSQHITSGHPDGRPVLYTSDGQAYDIATGSFLFNVGAGKVFTVSADNHRLCGVNTGISPYTYNCMDIRYSTFNNKIVTTASFSKTGIGSNGADLALSPDGKTLYVASGSPYGLVSYNLTTFASTTWLTDPYPNNVEVLDNGNVLTGSNSWYGPIDVWYFAANGSPLANYYQSGYADALYPRQVFLSGDQLRMVTLDDGGIMGFVTLP